VLIYSCANEEWDKRITGLFSLWWLGNNYTPDCSLCTTVTLEAWLQPALDWASLARGSLLLRYRQQKVILAIRGVSFVFTRTLLCIGPGGRANRLSYNNQPPSGKGRHSTHTYTGVACTQPSFNLCFSTTGSRSLLTNCLATDTRESIGPSRPWRA